MVTEKAPAVGEVHDRLEVPVPFAVRDTGVTVNALHVKPAGRGVSERPTEPTKLNVLVRETEIAEPVAPELKFTGLPTEIVKSPTCEMKLVE